MVLLLAEQFDGRAQAAEILRGVALGVAEHDEVLEERERAGRRLGAGGGGALVRLDQRQRAEHGQAEALLDFRNGLERAVERVEEEDGEEAEHEPADAGEREDEVLARLGRFVGQVGRLGDVDGDGRVFLADVGLEHLLADAVEEGALVFALALQHVGPRLDQRELRRDAVGDGASSSPFMFAFQYAASVGFPVTMALMLESKLACNCASSDLAWMSLGCLGRTAAGGP